MGAPNLVAGDHANVAVGRLQRHHWEAVVLVAMRQQLVHQRAGRLDFPAHTMPAVHPLVNGTTQRLHRPDRKWHHEPERHYVALHDILGAQVVPARTTPGTLRQRRACQRHHHRCTRHAHAGCWRRLHEGEALELNTQIVQTNVEAVANPAAHSSAPPPQPIEHVSLGNSASPAPHVAAAKLATHHFDIMSVIMMGLLADTKPHERRVS